MKTTLDIPDDLLHTMKRQAMREGRRFQDVVAEIFRRSLAQPEPVAIQTIRHRVKLPLIQCQHPATPAMELTANQVAEVLLKQEVDGLHEATRR